MKQVQKTIGRWVQRIAGKIPADAQAQAARKPVKLDDQTLRHVSGGTTDLPVKGW